MIGPVRRDLPGDAWCAIVERCGEVSRVEHASSGINADFAASLGTAIGPVFVKGVRLDSRNVTAHRTEARVNGYLPAALAPRMWWQAETAGWLLLAFEHISGRHADLTPGSPDLPLVVAAVTEVQEARTLFAVEVLGVWEWLLHNRPMPHRAALTDAARRWAKHRLERRSSDRVA